MPEQSQQEPGHDSDIGVEGIDLAQFTKDLIKDLNKLRTGQISIQQARATAELARQAIRAMHLVVSAQRLIEDRSKEVREMQEETKRGQ